MHGVYHQLPTISNKWNLIEPLKPMQYLYLTFCSELYVEGNLTKLAVASNTNRAEHLLPLKSNLTWRNYWRLTSLHKMGHCPCTECRFRHTKTLWAIPYLVKFTAPKIEVNTDYCQTKPCLLFFQDIHKKGEKNLTIEYTYWKHEGKPILCFTYFSFVFQRIKKTL